MKCISLIRYLSLALLFSVLVKLGVGSTTNPKKRRGLLFCYLIQDLEILAAASRELKRQGVSHLVYVHPNLFRSNFHVFRFFAANRVPFFFSFNRLDISLGSSSLRYFSFLLTAVETSRRPHLSAHQLVHQAKSLGLATYTCQHGLENIGLTYDDSQHPIKDTRILSDKIFIWGRKEQLDPHVLKENRDKCVETGYLKSLDYDLRLKYRLPAGFRASIGVFENLHWARFSQEYRDSFIASLLEMTTQFSKVLFVLKPHPAGKWLTNERVLHFNSVSNLLIPGRSSCLNGRFSGLDWIGNLDSIITTPSTIALDGALLEKGVAIVADDKLVLSRYHPLRMLVSVEDWATFITDTVERHSYRTDLSSSFVTRNCIDKNGWPKAVEEIRRGLR